MSFQRCVLATLLEDVLVGKHATHVFTFRGKTITQVSTKTWYVALEKAGINDFR